MGAVSRLMTRPPHRCYIQFYLGICGRASYVRGSRWRVRLLFSGALQRRGEGFGARRRPHIAPIGARGGGLRRASALCGALWGDTGNRALRFARLIRGVLVFASWRNLASVLALLYPSAGDSATRSDFPLGAMSLLISPPLPIFRFGVYFRMRLRRFANYLAASIRPRCTFSLRRLEVRAAPHLGYRSTASPRYLTQSDLERVPATAHRHPRYDDM